MLEGQWTNNGRPLRDLALRTKEAGNTGLMTRTRRGMSKAAAPAKAAIPAMERAVLPKEGGLNEWVASTPVRISVLTGPKTAGVLIRQSKRGLMRPHDLRRLNEQGIVRHPVFADVEREPDRRKWTWVAQYGLPTGWWDAALVPVRVEVTTEMLRVLHEASREAGFR